MRGVWRAWVAGLFLGLGPVAVVFAAGTTPSATAGVMLTGLLAAIPGLATLKLTLESESFLQGMRRSCGRVEILEDELDWRFRRRLRVATPVGVWRIQGSTSPFGRGLEVEPPKAHGTYTVREEPSQAGRVLMARLLTAQPALQDGDKTVARRSEERSARRQARRARRL